MSLTLTDLRSMRRTNVLSAHDYCAAVRTLAESNDAEAVAYLQSLKTVRLARSAEKHDIVLHHQRHKRQFADTARRHYECDKSYQSMLLTRDVKRTSEVDRRARIVYNAVRDTLRKLASS